MKHKAETMMKDGNNKTKDSPGVEEKGIEDSHSEAPVDMAQTAHTANPATGQGEEDPPGAYTGAKEAEPPILETPVSSQPQSAQASTAAPADETRASADFFNRTSGENEGKEDELGGRDTHSDSKLAGEGQEVPYSNDGKVDDDSDSDKSRSQNGGAHIEYKQATVRDEYVGQVENDLVRDMDSASKVHDSAPPSHERGESPVENDIVQAVHSNDPVTGQKQKHITQSNDDAIRSRSAPTSSKRNEGHAKGKKSSKSSKRSLWRRPVSLQSVPTVVSLFLPFGAVRGQQR